MLLEPSTILFLLILVNFWHLHEIKSDGYSLVSETFLIFAFSR